MLTYFILTISCCLGYPSAVELSGDPPNPEKDDAGGYTVRSRVHIDGVRLAGGKSDMDGVVEVKVGGVWGVVCDADWTEREARVTCRSLGLPGGRVGSTALWRLGQAPVHVSDVTCWGAEETLAHCLLVNQTRPCRFFDRAGVVCERWSPSARLSLVSPLSRPRQGLGFKAGSARHNSSDSVVYPRIQDEAASYPTPTSSSSTRTLSPPRPISTYPKGIPFIVARLLFRLDMSTNQSKGSASMATLISAYKMTKPLLLNSPAVDSFILKEVTTEVWTEQSGAAVKAAAAAAAADDNDDDDPHVHFWSDSGTPPTATSRRSLPEPSQPRRHHLQRRQQPYGEITVVSNTTQNENSLEAHSGYPSVALVVGLVTAALAVAIACIVAAWHYQKAQGRRMQENKNKPKPATEAVPSKGILKKISAYSMGPFEEPSSLKSVTEGGSQSSLATDSVSSTVSKPTESGLSLVIVEAKM